MTTAQSSNNDCVVFYYWPSRGRGEQIRLALAEAGVTFEQPTFDLANETEQLEYFAKCRELGGVKDVSDGLQILCARISN